MKTKYQYHLSLVMEILKSILNFKVQKFKIASIFHFRSVVKAIDRLQKHNFILQPNCNIYPIIENSKWLPGGQLESKPCAAPRIDYIIVKRRRDNFNNKCHLRVEGGNLFPTIKSFFPCKLINFRTELVKFMQIRH